MGNIIGMHNHRVGAKNSLADFFNECLEANISTVSITDHKTLDTYIKEFPKLSPEEIKNKNNPQNYICYTHYYPENEMFHNMETTYEVKVSNANKMKDILKAVDFKIIDKEVTKKMTIIILDKYYMNMKVFNESTYYIEFNTIDNHYITKQDYEELNDYLKKYDINHTENVF